MQKSLQIQRPYPENHSRTDFTDTAENYINSHTKSPKKVGVRYVSCSLILIVWKAHFTDTGCPSGINSHTLDHKTVSVEGFGALALFSVFLDPLGPLRSLQKRVLAKNVGVFANSWFWRVFSAMRSGVFLWFLPLLVHRLYAPTIMV